MFGPRWQDVGLDRGALQVVQALRIGKGGAWTLAAPKTRGPRRRVAVTAALVDALRRHRAAQRCERMALEPAWETNDLVFCDQLGRPYQLAHVLRYELHAVLRRAGLPMCSVHDLRHTGATLLLGRGVHPKMVSELLGHSTVSITLDIYSHMLPDMQAHVTAAMDAALGL